MSRHGFTLIEILITVLVIGLLGTAISQAMTQYSYRISATNKRIEALRHAETMMRDILRDARNGNVPETGISDGEVGDDPENPSGYAWQMEVDDYEIELPKDSEDLAETSPIFLDPNVPRTRRTPVMRRVTITVHRGDADVESGEVFTSYVVEPSAGFWEGSLGGGAGGRSGSRRGEDGSDRAGADDDDHQGFEHVERNRNRRRGPAIGNTN